MASSELSIEKFDFEEVAEGKFRVRFILNTGAYHEAVIGNADLIRRTFGCENPDKADTRALYDQIRNNGTYHDRSGHKTSIWDSIYRFKSGKVFPTINN